MPNPSPAPRPPRRRSRSLSALVGVLCLASATAPQDFDIADLLGMDLDDLMQVKIEVTTAAKKAQDLRAVPAAVYVLTGEEIRRSGASSLPEALRLVPGVLVRRIKSHQWDVSIRGFNTGFSNKLLVMIDGRSVYTPLFAGVHWDVQDLLLEDIDRIEVVRGPGGAIWGANAVNGVINIITKSSRETDHGLVSVLGGNEDRYIVGARQGGSFGETGTWRVYGKTSSRDGMELDGQGRHDDWHMHRGGFRMDWNPISGNTATLQGDIYSGHEHDDRFVPAVNDFGGFVERQDIRTSGNNLLFRWSHKRNDSETVTLQTYYDRTERDTKRLGEDRQTLDLEVTHHIDFGVHDVVWGIGHRVSQARFDNTDIVTITPERRTTNIFNVFVQDEMRLGKRVSLTLGTKFEHNSYVGWEVQPTARVAYRPTESQTIWSAVSRAVRTPSTSERDGYYFAGGFPGIDPGDPAETYAFVPGSDLGSETLYAYETGWRMEVSETLSFDVALFYHDFRNLETEEFGGPVIVAPGVEEYQYRPANNMEGIGRGLEVSGRWDVNPSWSLHGSYTYLDLHLNINDKSNDFWIENIADDDPQNVFHLRSHHSFAERWEADVLVYYASAMTGTLDVKSNWRADVRVGFKPDDRTELSAGVRNIFHDGQPDSYGNDAELAGYVKATRRF